MTHLQPSALACLRVLLFAVLALALVAFADSAWARVCSGEGATGKALHQDAEARLGRFFAGLMDGEPKYAIDHLLDNQPKRGFQDARDELIRQLNKMLKNGNMIACDLVGTQEFGPNLLRLNYLARTETTGFAFAFVMFRYRDSWVLEHICYTGELGHATEAGEGIFLCPGE